MTKRFILIVFFGLLMVLTSCYKPIIFPDMIEYSNDEVLTIAKEKYDISHFIYDSIMIRGNKEDLYDGIPFKIVNPDNVDVALISFAGKNGYEQRMFQNFKCYYALGITTEEKAIFIFYNLNLNKHDRIIDTVGSSDYYLDVRPDEIKKELFDNVSVSAIKTMLIKNFNKRLITEGWYLDRFILPFNASPFNTFGFEKGYIEFYRIENDIHYDVFDVIGGKKLFYTTNPQYSCITLETHNYSQYYDVSYEIKNAPLKSKQKYELNIDISIKSEYLDLISKSIYSFMILRVEQGYYDNNQYKAFQWTKTFQNTNSTIYTIYDNDYIKNFNEEMLTVVLSNIYILYKV